MLRNALQTVTRNARTLLSEAENATQKQQKRMMQSEHYTPKQYGKEAPKDRSFAFVESNPFIDAWVYRRDKLDREWVWNKRNTFEFTYFVLGGFAAAYWYAMWCHRNGDRRNNYPRRAYMTEAALGTGSQFILPDEREFY